MTKFADMYELGVRQFGIFVDDISSSEAARTCDMQIYMLNQVQTKLYETYNGEGAAEEDKVKPLFFTPAWYTTITSGASTYMPRLRTSMRTLRFALPATMCSPTSAILPPALSKTGLDVTRFCGGTIP